MLQQNKQSIYFFSVLWIWKKKISTVSVECKKLDWYCLTLCWFVFVWACVFVCVYFCMRSTWKRKFHMETMHLAEKYVDIIMIFHSSTHCYKRKRDERYLNLKIIRKIWCSTRLLSDSSRWIELSVCAQKKHTN